MSFVASNFIQRLETLTGIFSWGFCETFKSTFFTKHLWTTASDVYKKIFSTAKEMKTFIHRYVFLTSIFFYLLHCKFPYHTTFFTDYLKNFFNYFVIFFCFFLTYYFNICQKFGWQEIPSTGFAKYLALMWL